MLLIESKMIPITGIATNSLRAGGVFWSASSSSWPFAPYPGSPLPRARHKRKLLVYFECRCQMRQSQRGGCCERSKGLTKQPNSVWRSTLILSAWSCYLMWGMYTNTAIAGSSRLTALDSNHIPRPVASPHPTPARRPETRVRPQRLEDSKQKRYKRGKKELQQEAANNCVSNILHGIMAFFVALSLEPGKIYCEHITRHRACFHIGSPLFLTLVSSEMCILFLLL